MVQQLKLPIAYAWLQSRHDPRAELEAIVQAKLDAKAEIRAVLDRHAERFGVDPKDITAAIADYVADMLNDLFHEAKSRLETEIEDRDPV